jgi:hypothetical protein
VKAGSLKVLAALTAMGPLADLSISAVERSGSTRAMASAIDEAKAKRARKQAKRIMVAEGLKGWK